MSLGAGLMLVTLISGALQVVGRSPVYLLGRTWSLALVPGVLLYLIGVSGMVLQALGRLRWAGQGALLVLLTWGALLPVAHLLAFHVWGRCSQAHGAAMGWCLTADLVLLSIVAWSFYKLRQDPDLAG